MGLKALVLAGTTLATMTVGFAAPAFAAAQAVPKTATAIQQPTGDRHDDDISGLNNESPVCSALGTETIPTVDNVAKCLGTDG
jgi:hypothetical protein